jgi:hypothetical protein
MSQYCLAFGSIFLLETPAKTNKITCHNTKETVNTRENCSHHGYVPTQKEYNHQFICYHQNPYCLVWATELLLAAIGLVFPALVLGYNFFIAKSMTYQFLYRLKNLYDYRWQQ